MNFFDYHNKPLLRTVLVILTVANALVLAFLIFFARSPQAAAKEVAAASSSIEQEENEIPENLPGKGPLLELTDEKVRLKVGDEFDYRKYIESAVDRNGKDMMMILGTSGQRS